MASAWRRCSKTCSPTPASTPTGGRLEVELSTAGDTSLVRVRDNGMGISARMKPRIFELFVQDERSVDRSQGGLGIGLALVRHLIELHGGSIEAYSEGIGKGSEFLLRLRLLPHDLLPVDTATAVHTDGPGGRVMVVEDDPDVGESMTVLLRMYGYEVERAVDLESALQRAREFAPQAVLMDVALPGADGYEVARRLRLLPSPQGGMVFIAVSGFGDSADLQRSADEGFAEHLVKPVDPDELDAALRRHLGLRIGPGDGDDAVANPAGDAGG
ncbi:MAG: hybrid sensor histidine kinase/response regulator [Rubrivivax sp.]